jgi:hypothetical protein
MEAIWIGAEEPSYNKKGQPGAPQGRPNKPSRLEGQLASRYLREIAGILQFCESPMNSIQRRNYVSTAV